MKNVLGDKSNFADSFGPIVQLAYHAPDLEIAAEYWARTFKAGPFYLLEHIKLSKSTYRGQAASFDHSSAYGQLGDIMIELIHQHDDKPSAIRDMFDSVSAGLHHTAIFVDDVDAALEMAALKNMPCALDAITEDDVRFVMVDARSQHGHMLEFYEPCPKLRAFYSFIRRKSAGWDGKDFLRTL